MSVGRKSRDHAFAGRSGPGWLAGGAQTRGKFPKKKLLPPPRGQLELARATSLATPAFCSARRRKAGFSRPSLVEVASSTSAGGQSSLSILSTLAALGLWASWRRRRLTAACGSSLASHRPELGAMQLERSRLPVRSGPRRAAGPKCASRIPESPGHVVGGRTLPKRSLERASGL